MNAIAQFWRDFSWVKGRRRSLAVRLLSWPPRTYRSHTRRVDPTMGRGRAYERLRAARHAALWMSGVEGVSQEVRASLNSTF